MQYTAPSEDWLPEPGLRHLFTEFPLPLALVDVDRGHVVSNARFDSVLDPSVLRRPPLREMLMSPGLPWQTVSVPGCAGTLVEVRARALHTPLGAMLVLDEPHAGDAVPMLRVRELTLRVAELEHASATDRLTGAWNRRHFDQLIDSEVARSLAGEQPISLLVLDIDHFKRVNDVCGHAAGDAVLKEFARVLSDATRACDSVFRWGGEEFAVLAPATYGAAEQLAESLRQSVEVHRFPHGAPVTVSIGVAEHRRDESPQEWFVRADSQVYAAKEGGRNRVCVDRSGSSDHWLAGGGPLRLVWRPEYECGASLLDLQHRDLFTCANALIGSVSRDPRDPGVASAFDRLLEQTVQHFRDEEKLLAERSYVHLTRHASAHAGLVGRAMVLREAAEAGSLAFGAVVDFLANDVVARHMLSADRDFFPLFRDAARLNHRPAVHARYEASDLGNRPK